MFIISLGWSAAGVALFIYGLMSLRRKRLIEDTPTSTIRSMAMGQIEIVGRAEDWNTTRSPATGRSCAVFRYMIEKRGGDDWKTVARGDSFAFPFRVNDGTGTVTVYPKGSEFRVSPVDAHRTGGGGATLARLQAALGPVSFGIDAFAETETTRVTEWAILPGQNVYIMGSAGRMDVGACEREAKLSERLAELKQDPQKMAALDLDNDGITSVEEWDAARGRIALEVREEVREYKRAKNFEDQVVIEKGERGECFIISDRSHKSLVRTMVWHSYAGIVGGGALTLWSLSKVF